MLLSKRTNILFDQQLWNHIVSIAKQENTSVGKLIRTAVKEKYANHNQLTERAKAIDEILALKKQYKIKSTNKEI